MLPVLVTRVVPLSQVVHSLGVGDLSCVILNAALEGLSPAAVGHDECVDGDDDDGVDDLDLLGRFVGDLDSSDGLGFGFGVVGHLFVCLLIIIVPHNASLVNSPCATLPTVTSPLEETVDVGHQQDAEEDEGDKVHHNVSP